MANNYKKMVELRSKLCEAVKKNEYLKILKLQKEIVELEQILGQEEITVKELIKELPQSEKDKIVVLMNKVFAMADLLHGYANDFQSVMSKLEPNIIDVPVCKTARSASKMCLQITKEVSKHKDIKFVEDFQDMCDEIDLVASNIINRQYQRSRAHGRM